MSEYLGEENGANDMKFWCCMVSDIGCLGPMSSIVGTFSMASTSLGTECE